MQDNKTAPAGIPLIPTRDILHDRINELRSEVAKNVAMLRGAVLRKDMDPTQTILTADGQRKSISAIVDNIRMITQEKVAALISTEAMLREVEEGDMSAFTELELYKNQPIAVDKDDLN